MENLTFAAAFMRIYDRKIASGEISFSRIGMPKDDFTRLCIDSSYVPEGELIEKLCITMKLSDEECELFRSYIEA